MIDFTLDTTGLNEKLGKDLDRVLRATFFDLNEYVVFGGPDKRYSPGTPVDLGFARNSWWVSVNDPGSPKQPARPTAKVSVPLQPNVLDPSSGAGDIFYLSTNCVYMRVLEFTGHSPQAPNGFVRLALSGLQDMLDRNVATVMGRR